MDQRITTTTGALSEASFISKVFLWMALGLALSTASSFWLLSQPAVLKGIFGNGWALFAIVIAELGLVFWLSAGLFRMSTTTAASVYAVYSLLNGVTLTSILLVYTGASVVNTFMVSAGTFFFFSVYGITTKKDLTSVGSLAFMGLIGIILASLLNMLLKNSTFDLVITFIGIAVFIGLIAYDTQNLKAIYAMGIDSQENEKRYVILGALRLYLDFINLFIMLLRIFGRRRD